MQQTQGWWHDKTQKHGCKKRQILTVGNVEVTLQLPYVVKRQNQLNKDKKSLHEGFCPFLRYLGMSQGVTPVVLSTIAQYGAIAGSFEAARTTLIDWGINISLKRIERLTYYFGQLGLDLRNKKLNDLKSGNLLTLNTLKDQRVVILSTTAFKILKYNEVAFQKLPLGSVAVESLIRQVVNLRIKGNGKFWLKNNAEIMLHLRAPMDSWKLE